MDNILNPSKITNNVIKHLNELASSINIVKIIINIQK